MLVDVIKDITDAYNNVILQCDRSRQTRAYIGRSQKSYPLSLASYNRSIVLCDLVEIYSIVTRLIVTRRCAEFGSRKPSRLEPFFIPEYNYFGLFERHYYFSYPRSYLMLGKVDVG